MIKNHGHLERCRSVHVPQCEESVSLKLPEVFEKLSVSPSATSGVQVGSLKYASMTVWSA